MADLIALDQARVNVTWGGQNGDLPDPVPYGSADGDVKQWITEAVRAGGVPNIPADPEADFTDFIVDRYAATDQTPYNRIFIRPKTAYGRHALTRRLRPAVEVEDWDE